MAVVLLIFVVARQFYDHDTICLRPGDNCLETPGAFKDDTVEPPPIDYPSDDFYEPDPFNEEGILEA